MNIQIVPISIKQKDILAKLLKTYKKELRGKGQHGEYKYLDSYWQEKDRHPFFIKANGDIAGFALVNNYSIIEKGAKSIAEFSVLKKFRKKGVGKNAAKQLFDLFPGKWEIRELKNNLNAKKFWRSVIKDYSNNNFKETIINDARWKGYIQTFRSIPSNFYS